ncbi:hypothetical protein XENTR_v10024713 [Xenopus tropicalis]|nr:hypothetical protein XENTR_v10024713 [Xenopus tropicalis]
MCLNRGCPRKSAGAPKKKRTITFIKKLQKCTNFDFVFNNNLFFFLGVGRFVCNCYIPRQPPKKQFGILQSESPPGGTFPGLTDPYTLADCMMFYLKLSK